MKKIILATCLFIIVTCSKKEELNKTFIGNLPIVSATSPTATVARQKIISNVRCELSSLSGSVYFQGFEITETSQHHFNISANALYKNWNTQIGMPVIWTMDTTVSINTTISGAYILNFYNAAVLLKSDTVAVN